MAPSPPSAILKMACPECGHGIEFFKDEISRACGQCGARVYNDHNDHGCRKCSSCGEGFRPHDCPRLGD